MPAAVVVLKIGDAKADQVALSAVQVWLAERGLQTLALAPPVDAYGGRFADLPIHEFAKAVLEQSWLEPDRVALLIQPEEGGVRMFKPTWQR